MSIRRTIVVAGGAGQMEGVPVSYEQLKEAITTTSRSATVEKSLQTLALGREFMLEKTEE